MPEPRINPKLLAIRAARAGRKYGQAYAALGFTYVFNYQNRWTADSNSALRQAKQAAELEKAKRVWDGLMHINPHYAFNDHYARQSFANKDDVRRLARGPDRAGLPH